MRRGPGVARRPLLSVLAAAATVTCSLLVNTGLAGHPCGPDDSCLSGYLCNRRGICVPAAEGGCATSCPTGQKCVRQQCVDVCQGLACPPGETCGSNTCVQVAADGTAGAPCADDTGCHSDLGLHCLQPYTGGAATTGVCTATCTKAPDNCGDIGQGETCTTFPSDTPSMGSSGIDLCAPPGLTACTSDSACHTSGLVCSVLHVNLPAGVASASACVSPIANGASAGSPCTLSGMPCTSGLCVADTNGTSRYCTSPCATAQDCSSGYGSSFTCTNVTIAEDSSALDNTRAQVCIPNAASLGEDCTSTGGNNCSADAPFCVPVPEADGGMPSDGGTARRICAPYCTQGSTPCPSGGSTPLTCDMNSDQYAGKCQ